jgi:6-phosphogluconolactonase
MPTPLPLTMKSSFVVSLNSSPANSRASTLILLGMGPDGHTASLFPDSAALEELSRLVVANWVAKFNTSRITFTFPVLNRAAEVMFMASGSDKADMLHQVLEAKNTPPLPSQRVQPSDGKLLWMLDDAAAAKLSR